MPSTGRVKSTSPVAMAAQRHAVVLRRGGCLGNGHSAVLFDGAQPKRSVASGPREDNAYGELLLVFAERVQEGVDVGANLGVVLWV